MVSEQGAVMFQLKKWMLAVLHISILPNKDIAAGNSGKYCLKLKVKNMTFVIFSLVPLSSTAEKQ